mgnify:CR=1 FL=1
MRKDAGAYGACLCEVGELLGIEVLSVIGDLVVVFVTDNAH